MTYVLFCVLFYNSPRPTTYLKIKEMTFYRETVSDALKYGSDSYQMVRYGPSSISVQVQTVKEGRTISEGLSNS